VLLASLGSIQNLQYLKFGENGASLSAGPEHFSLMADHQDRGPSSPARAVSPVFAATSVESSDGADPLAAPESPIREADQ